MRTIVHRHFYTFSHTHFTLPPVAKCSVCIFEMKYSVMFILVYMVILPVHGVLMGYFQLVLVIKATVLEQDNKHIFKKNMSMNC